MKRDHRDIYLEYFAAITRSNFLHYGFWHEPKDASIDTLGAAQARYLDIVLKTFPPPPRTILDVGCGLGGVAEALLDSGYSVTCLAPDSWQRDIAASRIGDRAKVIGSRFEDFVSPERYDVILFCESAQYVDLAECFQKSAAYCRPGGQLVVSDYFILSNDSHHPMTKSGHPKEQFLERAAEYGFVLSREIDITRETAPTLEVAKNAYITFLKPTADFLLDLICARHSGALAITGGLRNDITEELGDILSLLDADEFVKLKQYVIFQFEAPT